MPKPLKDLRLRQVEESLLPWLTLPTREPPHGGWIKAVRQALGMTTTQLGRRMGLSRQGIADLERREVGRVASLAALARAAEAMDAVLVYAIVPRTSLRDTLRNQAHRRAESDLRRVAHSMQLEAQGVAPAEYQQQLSDNQETLLRTWSRIIWDEE